MKKLTTILVALTGLLWVGQVRAQNTNAPPSNGQPGMHGGGADERFNRLSQELDLSKDQQAKVQAIFEEIRQKIQAAVEEGRSNAETQLQSVLTPQQYQKLQNIWQQHERRGGGGGSNNTQGTTQ